MQPETVGWQVWTREQMHPTIPPTTHSMCTPAGQTGPSPPQTDAAMLHEVRSGRSDAESPFKVTEILRFDHISLLVITWVES